MDGLAFIEVALVALLSDESRHSFRLTGKPDCDLKAVGMIV
jgi:hypothetical protein